MLDLRLVTKAIHELFEKRHSLHPWHSDLVSHAWAAHQEALKHPIIRIDRPRLTAFLSDGDGFIDSTHCLRGAMRLPCCDAQGVWWFADHGWVYAVVEEVKNLRRGNELWMFLVRWSSSTKAFLCPMVGRTSLDEERVGKGGCHVECHPVHPITGESKEFLEVEVLTAFGAIALMNCKNVERREAVLTGSQQRAVKRGEPVTRYHELVIREKSQRNGTVSVSHEVNSTPLHLCRGHLRHYREGESTGLFGRGQFGTFWVPAHFRGKEENGVVHKDYVLETA